MKMAKPTARLNRILPSLRDVVMICNSLSIRHVGVCLLFVVPFAGCGSDDVGEQSGAGGKQSNAPTAGGGTADAGGGGGDSAAGGFDTPDAALDAYGRALVDGDMPAFRKIAAKDSRAVAGMEAIIQMQKDKSPEEAAKINLQALAPHQGFGDAVSKRFAAEIDGDNAVIVQLFEREIAFEKKIHFRKFKFSKSDGRWSLVGSGAGEVSELPDRYAWDGQAGAKTVVSSGPMPMSLIPQDAFAAVVVHPKRAASSEIGQALLKLDVVQAGLEKSNVKPNDVERIIYAMGIPTEESENDCTIVQFGGPMSQATLLQEEFGDLPYEKVQFQGATYYRYADESSADEAAVAPVDMDIEKPEAAPFGKTMVLAKYPDDRQPDANGHPDSSDSGNWVYFSSDKQNPSLPDARLARLAWNPKESRYEGNELRVNRMWPAVGRSLAPAQKSPRYPVLRWESRTSAALTIRGTFKAIPGAKSGDGVRVLVFVDGRQEFSMDVKRGDTTGVQFVVSAAVEPGWPVDFVVDPKANVGYDSTLLEATIERSGGKVAAKPVLVDTRPKPAAGDGEAATLSGTAIYFPDDKTIVSTDEQRMRSLISGPPAQTPLTEKLSQLDLDHDLVGVVVLDGYQDQAAGLLDMAAKETGSGELAGLAAMPRHTKSAVATFDLAGDSLLRLTLEAADAESATQLHDGAKNLVALLRGLRDALPQQMPDATASPLLPLFDDFIGGVTVRQDALNVVVDAKRPSGLADFVRSDGARVVSSMGPRAVPPRPGINSTREIELFNGEDLAGWTYVPLKFTKSRTNKSWSVDKERQVLYTTGGDWSDLATVESFRDFDLKLQWRWRPDSQVSPNGSGVVVRTERLDAGEPNADGLEIDLRPGKDSEKAIGTGTFIAYNVSFRNHRGTADGVADRILGWLREPKHVDQDQWNDLRISCLEDRVTVTLNGVVVNEGQGLSAREGKITLRSQNSGIEFRNIRLTEVQPRLDVTTTHEFDPPEGTPESATHGPPPKSHVDFRDLVINTHDCRVRFPGNPRPEQQSIDTSAGKIEISTFTAEHKGCAYAFSILDYPPSIVSKAGAQTLLNEYRGGIVDEPNGTLLDSKMSNYQGSPSNDFQYVDPDYGAGEIAHCRTVLKGNRMFHLKVVGKAPTADIHAYFQSLVTDGKAGGGPPAGTGTTGQPSAAATIIEPTEDNWEVGAGNLEPVGGELVVDADGGRYWVICREPLPANFRLQIEGRIEFLQGGQVLQNTQKDILRSMCVRFCTTDQKADILDAKGYHIRHSHTMLLLSKEGKVIARGDVGNGPRQVSAIPTANGLKVTIPDREPWPFTMAVTKKDDAISVEVNGAKVVDHADRFYLSSSDKLAIGGYTSRLYLGRVSVTDLGPAKPAPGTPGGAMEIVDRNSEPGRFQPLLLRHPVDRMVLSEDARYLAATHREADSISVIDVQSLDLVKTIDTPAPRAILWRGDHLFAANEGLGTISMFSESGQWKKVKSITLGDPNPEYMSAPGGRNYRGVIAVRCRGNGRDALPVMIVQSRAGSPNRYIAGVYNFAAVSQGRATQSMGEHVDSFPLLYQVGATPYWFGGRKVFAGMPMKAMIEAEQLLVADRVIDVCYTFRAGQMRCIGLGRTLEDLGSRPIDLPDRVMDVTDIGDLHVAATIGSDLHFFLLDSQRTIHTVRLPAFEVPSFFTKTDRADTVAKAFEPAREETEPDEPAAGKPIKRTWTDASGRFQIEADRDFIGRHVATDN